MQLPRRKVSDEGDCNLPIISFPTHHPRVREADSIGMKLLMNGLRCVESDYGITDCELVVPTGERVHTERLEHERG
jgi:hypothetical protein